MSKYTYEEYIKNNCHPTGYNEPCQSYIFSQSTIDVLLDKITNLENVIIDNNITIEYLRKDNSINLDTIKSYINKLTAVNQRWNKLKEYLNKQKENFKKMLPTGYASNEMLGKLWFAESILKTMKNLEKGGK